MSKRWSDPGHTSRLFALLNEDLDERRETVRRTSGHPETDTQWPALRVQLCELYPEDNAHAHHTDRYQLVHTEPKMAVLRRGQTFSMALRFDRPYEPHKDTVRIIFNFMAGRQNCEHLVQMLTVTEQTDVHADSTSWDVAVHRRDNSDPHTIVFQVWIPPCAQVGIWRLDVQSSRKDRPEATTTFRCPRILYILFNPWCKEDGVYLEREDQRGELVLNEHGKLWLGDGRSPARRFWALAQFHECALPCAALLLQEAQLGAQHRGDPVLVARAIAAAVRELGYDGIPSGQHSDYWMANLKREVKPKSWAGSSEIMETYLRTKQPVHLSQYWMYAALTVTVCRALGIPSRAVTNFSSARDGDGTSKIDFVYTLDGELERDDFWSFHVWTEVWMARNDLPQGYNGWQVIDSVTSGRNGERAECGPASVEAVRRGVLCYHHDTPSVFAQVNADVEWFRETRDPDWRSHAICVHAQRAGSLLVTKAVGKDDDNGDADMENITRSYKDIQASPQSERFSLSNAAHSSVHKRPRKVYNSSSADVSYELVDLDAVSCGHDFTLTLRVHNTSDKIRNVSCILVANTMYYTGQKAAQIKRVARELRLEPRQHENFVLKIGAMEYLHKLTEEGLISVFVIAETKETKQSWCKEDTICLVKPRISIQVRGSPRIGKPTSATLSFQNPLPAPLTECSYAVEGPGLQMAKRFSFRDIKAGEVTSFDVSFVPWLEGQRKLTAVFCSRQLSGLNGRATVSVAPA